MSRPEEPTGVWARVVDSDGTEWTRDERGRWCHLSARWWNSEGEQYEPNATFRAWGDIDAVRVLSEGVTR